MNLEKIRELYFKWMFYRFVKNPTNSQLTFRLSDLGRSLKRAQSSMGKIEVQLEIHSEFIQAWQQKWMPPRIKNSELGSYPAHTLGSKLLLHLQENNLDLDTFPDMNPQTLPDYLTHRLRCSHDLWHALLGYDSSPCGEIQVQAFFLGQLKTPASVVLIVGGLLSELERAPEGTPMIFEESLKAFRRGSESRFLLNYKLEEMLDQPIDRVRHLVGLE